VSKQRWVSLALLNMCCEFDRKLLALSNLHIKKLLNSKDNKRFISIAAAENSLSLVVES
jgi:hypothetical protein